MSSVKQRLQQFLKEEGISASEFSRKMGLSPAYLASMRKSMPEDKVTRLISLYPQLNRDWLLYGEGEMYREMENPEINPHRLDRYMIPLVPVYAAAGSLAGYAEGVRREDCEMIYCPNESAELAIKVKGDSMEPRIPTGAILCLERITDRMFVPWGIPLVIDSENGSVCKMLYPDDKDDESLQARSYNPNYPPFKIDKQSIFGIYRIVYMMVDGISL